MKDFFLKVGSKSLFWVSHYFGRWKVVCIFTYGLASSSCQVPTQKHWKFQSSKFCTKTVKIDCNFVYMLILYFLMMYENEFTERNHYGILINP